MSSMSMSVLGVAGFSKEQVVQSLTVDGQRGATSRIAGGGQGDRRLEVDNAGAPAKQRTRLCTTATEAVAARIRTGGPRSPT
jgi:hypothetical protein